MRLKFPWIIWIPLAFLFLGLLSLAGCGVLLPLGAQAAMQSDSMQSFLKQPGKSQSPAGQPDGGPASADNPTRNDSDPGVEVGAIANTVPEVRWIEDRNSKGARPSGGLARAAAAATTRPSASGTASGQLTNVATAALNHSSTGIDRQAVLQQLRGMIRDSKDPAMIKALSAVALSVADPSVKLDPTDVAALDPSLRQLVLGYYQLLGQPAVKQAPIDRAAVAAGVSATPANGADAATPTQPIEIRTVQLCKRVRGFGSYDPFESSTFLAGRDQKIWIYVELDHFRSAKNAKGLFEVRLAQSVALYHDSDGLEVWKQPEAEIPDESRNQRRDFFVVEPIILPARLSVGKFLLKVRVIDRHGDSVAESSVPLQIVADQSLVSTGQ